MKQKWCFVAVLAVVPFLSVAVSHAQEATTAPAPKIEANDDSEWPSLVSGRLTVTKDETGKVVSAKISGEELDDDLNVVKTTYDVVLDAKGEQMCNTLAGKEVDITGHIEVKGEGKNAKKLLKVRTFEAVPSLDDEDAE